MHNFAYAKEVLLVYSTDGWRTVQTSPASYLSRYLTGSGTSVLSPNKNGVEIWSGAIANPGVELQLAIRYRCDGQEHWDNNFGVNYTIRPA